MLFAEASDREDSSLAAGNSHADRFGGALDCQVNRMRDGQRRVTQVTEIIRMEGDIITTHDLFTYKFLGEGSDGKLRGTFVSSGIRPAFLPRAQYYGLDKMLLEAI